METDRQTVAPPSALRRSPVHIGWKDGSPNVLPWDGNDSSVLLSSPNHPCERRLLAGAPSTRTRRDSSERRALCGRSSTDRALDFGSRGLHLSALVLSAPDADPTKSLHALVSSTLTARAISTGMYGPRWTADFLGSVCTADPAHALLAPDARQATSLQAFEVRLLASPPIRTPGYTRRDSSERRALRGLPIGGQSNPAPTLPALDAGPVWSLQATFGFDSRSLPQHGHNRVATLVRMTRRSTSW